MKSLKLILGILCLVFSLLVLFQSCAVGLSNALTESNDLSGSAGFFIFIVFIVSGIIMIVTRASNKNGGSIVNVILFSIAAITGFSNVGIFSDLQIWSWFCVILAIVNLISIFKSKKNTNLDTSQNIES